MAGRKRYVVEPLYRDIDMIQQELGLTTNAAAQMKAVEYLRVGREFEKIRDKFVLADLFKKRKR